MAQTNIFAGNHSNGIITLGNFPIYPGYYIRIDDKFTIGEILHDDRLIQGMANGDIEVRCGGTVWSNSSITPDMLAVFSSLTEEEQLLGAGYGGVSGGSGTTPAPGP
jgi:hypothetical protein